MNSDPSHEFFLIFTWYDRNLYQRYVRSFQLMSSIPTNDCNYNDVLVGLCVRTMNGWIDHNVLNNSRSSDRDYDHGNHTLSLNVTTVCWAMDRTMDEGTLIVSTTDHWRGSGRLQQIADYILYCSTLSYPVPLYVPHSSLFGVQLWGTGYERVHT
jgi:hypothetical protein